MNKEKDILRQDLSKQEKPEEIKKFIEDIELIGGHEDIVALAKSKLEAIEKRAGEITPKIETTESQKTQVETMGGSESGLQEATAAMDEKIKGKDTEIKKVEVETEQKIEGVKNETQEINKSRLTQLKNFKQNPKFASLLNEVKKYLELKRKLKDGTDKSIQLGNVQDQSRKYDELKQLIDPNIGLAASDIIQIDNIINVEKKKEEKIVDDKIKEKTVAFLKETKGHFNPDELKKIYGNELLELEAIGVSKATISEALGRYGREIFNK